MAKLTPKQKDFADFYIVLGNAEQAAIKAGYSKRYARGNAHKLVANSCIKSYIAERMQLIESERIASQEEVLQFLTSVIRGEVTEEVPILIGDGMQTLRDKEVSVKERVKAAELLGKRYMMWTEKQQVEMIEPVFVDDVPEED